MNKNNKGFPCYFYFNSSEMCDFLINIKAINILINYKWQANINYFSAKIIFSLWEGVFPWGQVSIQTRFLEVGSTPYGIWPCEMAFELEVILTLKFDFGVTINFEPEMTFK